MKKRFLCNKIAVVCSENEVDKLCVEEVTLEDGSKGVIIGSDVTLLFNQQRLNRLSQTYIDGIITNLRTQSDNMFKGYSDEEIAKSIRSRYIQSPADVYNFNRKLQSEITEFKTQLDKERKYADLAKKYQSKDEKNE